MSKIQASIIVASWNRAQILEKALPLLLNQEVDFAFEVVVADDGSTDNTLQVLEKMASPRLKALALPHRGISHARNRAVESAEGRILVFADDDCLVKPDFLRNHLEKHSQNNNLAVTGPIVNIEDIDGPLPSMRPWKGWHNNPFPGCNCSLSKELYTKAGGFWEAFTEYGWEDMEFWLRAKKAGASPCFAPKAAVFHFKPKSRQRDLALQIRLERQRGQMGALFYGRHPKASVSFLVKKNPVMGMMDSMLNRLLKLEDTCRQVETGLLNPDTLSPLMHKLLVLHSEISRAQGRF
ncbi:MAG: glycosyltransferase [Desulfatibacillaceae bacterium]|nr:glycosyltransferase [Desulfatibacillaceae bacterium]